MNRAEAIRRLEASTRFQFVGDKVLIRSVAVIEALKQVKDGSAAAALTGERDASLDTALVLAA